MELKAVFYACLLLCIIAFIDVLISVKQNRSLKVCLLLIIISLFVMNYFSFVTVANRLQLVLVKTMRLVYATSTMLLMINLVTPKIPKWIITFTTLSAIFLVGLRIFYFHEIDIESQVSHSSQVFSVGPELYNPSMILRYSVFTLASIVVGITFHYYRRFFVSMNREDLHYRPLSRWIISIVMPFFLLIIFGILGLLNIFPDDASPYLFAIFSCTIVFSILLRPKFLNKNSFEVLFNPLPATMP